MNELDLLLCPAQDVAIHRAFSQESSGWGARLRVGLRRKDVRAVLCGFCLFKQQVPEFLSALRDLEVTDIHLALGEVIASTPSPKETT
jgi:hypothetical protein